MINSMWGVTHAYEKVALEECAVSLDKRKPRYSCASTLMLCLNLGLFMASLVIVWTSVPRHSCSPQTTAELLKRTSTPCSYYLASSTWVRLLIHPTAPIFDRVQVTFEDKHMNATLLPSPNDEVFRGSPSAEVDRAWHRIGNTQPIALSKEEIVAAGIDPSEAVQFPDSWGLGEAYAGRVDVFHQVHCLDT